jgi:hypothetical protein
MTYELFPFIFILEHKARLYGLAVWVASSETCIQPGRAIPASDLPVCEAVPENAKRECQTARLLHTWTSAPSARVHRMSQLTLLDCSGWPSEATQLVQTADCIRASLVRVSSTSRARYGSRAPSALATAKRNLFLLVHGPTLCTWQKCYDSTPPVLDTCKYRPAVVLQPSCARPAPASLPLIQRDIVSGSRFAACCAASSMRPW